MQKFVESIFKQADNNFSWTKLGHQIFTLKVNMSILGGRVDSRSHSPATMDVTGSRPTPATFLRFIFSSRYSLRHRGT